MKIEIPGFTVMAKCNEHMNHGTISIDLGPDVVKVVQCMDCRYGTLMKSGFILCNKLGNEELSLVMAQNDFCSYGAEKGSKKNADADEDAGGALDPMFEYAVECVIEAGKASTGLLQRRCNLGYARAARIMNQMEQKKVIGPYEGTKPRAVLISQAQWQERKLSAEHGERSKKENQNGDSD